MPASSVNINLLTRDELSNTPVGRLLAWAVTYGRYIMVLTELVVLITFVSRFSLDRKLTDLNEEIAQKQSILEVNSQLEVDIRTLQGQLAQIKTITQIQNKPVDTLYFLQSILPSDVSLTSVNLQKDKLIVSAIAGTTNGFSTFLNSLTANKKIGNIQVDEIKRQSLTGIEFRFTASLIGK